MVRKTREQEAITSFIFIPMVIALGVVFTSAIICEVTKISMEDMSTRFFIGGGIVTALIGYFVIKIEFWSKGK
jgi:hypothetical protein